MSDISSIHSNFAIRGAYSSSKSLDKGNGIESKPGVGFQELVQQATSDAMQTIRDGDAVMRAGLAGKAGVQEVVEATLAMESTLKVSIALRDKLVDAYHEILKMPI